MSTAAPTSHTTPTGVRPGGSVGHVLDKVPGQWMSAVIVIILLIGLAMQLEHKHNTKNTPRAVSRAVSKSMNKSLKTRGQQQDDAVAKFLGFVFGSLWRFVSGREMSGKPASNATWARRGRRPLSRLMARDTVASQLGTVAIPEQPLPAVPAGPSAAVERWRGWVDQHTVPEALDGAVRRGGTAAVWLGGSAHAGLRGVSAAGGHTRRALRAWGTWPYACRALLRWAVVLTALGLWLHGPGTILALVAVVVVALAVAASGPSGLGWWRGVQRTDADRFGPHLWVALRHLLDMTEAEYHDPHLHLPADLSVEAAAVTLLLPDHYASTEPERQQLDHVVNTRLPGDWVARFEMMARPPRVTWTHKPKPRPKPCPPDYVDFWDPEIQAAIARCERGEVVVGRDEHGRIITRRFGGATPHWALSVATGGGKSAFNLMVLVQLIAQGFHIVIIDVKRVSLAALAGVPGVHIYNDPESPQDMRAAIMWVGDEMKARSAVLEVAPERYFPGLMCVIEEATEAQRVLRAEYDDFKTPKDPASDPIWQKGVMNGVNLGRAMWAHFLFVTQDMRDDTFGGKGLRNGFALKFMGSFNAQQWKNVIGTSPVPDAIAKAGRMMMVEGTTQQGWVQTCWSAPDVPVEVTLARLREWAIQKRREIGFDPEAGLFGAPPEHSPKVLPKLLRAASRDKLPEGVWKALEQGPDGSGAGGAVTSRSHDAARDSLVPGQRDGSGEVLSEPLSELGEADRRGLVSVYTELLNRRQLEPGAVADTIPALPAGGVLSAIGNPNERLTLTEISRRLEERGIEIKANTMSQHKKRGGVGDRQFPAGAEMDGKTLYNMAEIVQFYQPEILKNWGRGSAENGQE